MEITTAEANRQFYAEAARDYDGTEHCITSPEKQQRLERVIDVALGLMPDASAVLDACGGSGNASERLAARGLEPVLVDVSPQMIGVWREKAAGLGLDPETHVAEVEAFLREDPRSWDLIVFSSALHHLEDYRGVLALAARRLAPGGAIVTAFDPIAQPLLPRLLARIDWLLWELVTRPKRGFELLSGRLRRTVSRDASPTIAQLAERHDAAGIDDVALARFLAAEGMEVIEHGRHIDSRLRAVGWLRRGLGAPTSFSLVVRSPVGAARASGRRS